MSNPNIETRKRFGNHSSQIKVQNQLLEKSRPADAINTPSDHNQQLLGCIDTELERRRQAFNEQYATWIAEQNQIVESCGIPLSSLRPW